MLQRGTGFEDVSLDAIESSIRAGQDHLLGLFERAEESPYPEESKHPGGYWMGELEADTTLESDYIVFLSFLDRNRYAEKIQRLARTIIEEQLEDGSWNIYRGGPGEISATVKAYMALRLAGYRADEPAMVRAKHAALRLGGAERVNSYTKFYMALLGQIDWDDVPALPPEVILLPRFFTINIYEISYWSRAILIPLSILYSKRVVRVPEEGQLIDELFHDKRSLRKNLALSSISTHTPGSNGVGVAVDPARANHPSGQELGTGKHAGNGHDPHFAIHGNGNGNGNGAANGNGNGNGAAPAVPKRRGDAAILSWENFFLVTDRVLKLVERTPLKPLRKMALKRAEEWMIARFADSDGLGAIFPSMVNSVMAMQALGYGEDHPHVIEAMRQLERLEIHGEDRDWLQPCLSPIWDTAKAVNALHESGVPSDDERLIDAARWLVSKEVRKPGDWSIRLPRVEVGGWPFQFRNEFYPDVDDTAAVVMALGRVDPTKVEGINDAIARGIRWVVDMQCSSGGWAAFDVDVEKEFLTKVPYADHNAMLDPPCADITGRCLEMFSRFPDVLELPHVRRVVERAVRYLRRIQEPDGAWYGRWGVNFIYGTWQALKGLIGVGEDPNEEYIRRAVRFLLECQNDDGGWGESCASYEGNDPAFRGRGPSTPSQTAWALMGLIIAGEVDSDAVQRGIRYLVETQLEDGSWDEDHGTGTGFPRVFYLKYHYYRLYFPIFALGMYRNAKMGISRARVSGDGGRQIPDFDEASIRRSRARFRD